MYHIMSGVKRLIADNTAKSYAVSNDVLTTAENTSGDLSFVVSPENVEYAALASMRSEITVEDDGVEIWRGRVISQEYDMDLNKTVTVKGVLDYLHDTFVRPMLLVAPPGEIFRSFILEHNRAVDAADKKFTIGTIDSDPEDVSYEIQSFKSTFDLIADLIKQYGGYVSVYRLGDANCIQWVKTRSACSQEIVYGQNLLSLQVSVDPSGIVTRLYGYGKKQEDGTYVDITSIDGVPYVQDVDAIDDFGVILGTLSKSDVEDPAELKQAMTEELHKKLSETRSIEATAFDLHDFGYQAERIEAGQLVRIVAPNHRIDEEIPVKKIQRHLWEPGKTKVTLGSSRQSISNILTQIKEVV